MRRIVDFVLRRLLAWRYPHLVVEDACIYATDAAGYDYEYVPALGIFDPVDTGGA